VNSPIEILVQKAPLIQNYLVKTASRESSARLLLLGSEGHAAASLYMAARVLYGVDILHWEPETLWLTLQQDGIELPVAARSKIMAATTLQLNPAFYWDSHVFQNTVQALNDEHSNPEAIQECHPAHMAWAVHEAGFIRGLDPHDHEIPEFDEDVQMYVAVCLKRAGLLLPPHELDTEEIQNVLDKQYSPEAKYTRNEAREAWRKLPKNNLQHTEFAEDTLGVQLAQLAACHVYVDMKAEELALEIHELNNL
jgi:hypothetical protein